MFINHEILKFYNFFFALQCLQIGTLNLFTRILHLNYAQFFLSREQYLLVSQMIKYTTFAHFSNKEPADLYKLKNSFLFTTKPGLFQVLMFQTCIHQPMIKMKR